MLVLSTHDVHLGICFCICSIKIICGTQYSYRLIYRHLPKTAVFQQNINFFLAHQTFFRPQNASFRFASCISCFPHKHTPPHAVRSKTVEYAFVNLPKGGYAEIAAASGPEPSPKPLFMIFPCWEAHFLCAFRRCVSTERFPLNAEKFLYRRRHSRKERDLAGKIQRALSVAADKACAGLL